MYDSKYNDSKGKLFTVAINSSMLLAAMFVTVNGLFATLNINDTQRKQHSQ